VSKMATSCLAAAVVNGSASEDMASHLWDTFCSVNTFLTTESGIDCTFSGATATVSVLIGTRLTSAWVGDSRAVLGRMDGGTVHAFDLTNDHKPDLPEETARIEGAGGRVEPLLVRSVDYCASALLRRNL
jgi:serine/threonine protein phosphatase PrpC